MVEGGFTICCDAYRIGLGYVFIQNCTVVAYISYQLKFHEKNYLSRDFELDEIVFALKI